MKKKLVQILIVLSIGLILTSASPLPSIDEGDGGSTKAYCVAAASNPVISGSDVKGTGTVTCTGTTGWIRVVVQVRDWGEDDEEVERTSASYERTCRNASSCSVSAYLDYIGYYWHYYETLVSGYYPNNSTYDSTYPHIRLPY